MLSPDSPSRQQHSPPAAYVDALESEESDSSAAHTPASHDSDNFADARSQSSLDSPLSLTRDHSRSPATKRFSGSVGAVFGIDPLPTRVPIEHRDADHLLNGSTPETVTQEPVGDESPVEPEDFAARVSEVFLTSSLSNLKAIHAANTSAAAAEDTSKGATGTHASAAAAEAVSSANASATAAQAAASSATASRRESLKRLDPQTRKENAIKSGNDIVRELTTKKLRELVGRDLSTCKYPLDCYFDEPRFQMTDLAGIECINNEAMEELSVNNCRLSRLADLDYFVKLKRLFASNNNIEQVKINFTCLEVLDVSKNRLCEIPDMAGCPNLKELDCSKNEIRGVWTGLLHNDNLEVLDLRKNQLQWTQEDFECVLGIMQGWPKLKELNLMGNKVHKMDGYRYYMSTYGKVLELLDGVKTDGNDDEKNQPRVSLKVNSHLETVKYYELHANPDAISHLEGSSTQPKAAAEDEDEAAADYSIPDQDLHQPAAHPIHVFTQGAGTSSKDHLAIEHCHSTEALPSSSPQQIGYHSELCDLNSFMSHTPTFNSLPVTPKTEEPPSRRREAPGAGSEVHPGLGQQAPIEQYSDTQQSSLQPTEQQSLIDQSGDGVRQARSAQVIPSPARPSLKTDDDANVSAMRQVDNRNKTNKIAISENHEEPCCTCVLS